MSKRTPWFDGKKYKPVRVGVYELMSLGQLGYQYWNGEAWGLWSISPTEARKDGLFYGACTRSHQHDDWRGLIAEAP